ncbi:MAG: TetR/AcrR family transcriptional regulator [Gemmatimonadaceae bacterium]|nr:TetR/AcrR family transcriptional regulator [Gemmatimonadaceae bacterium]
MVRTEAQNAAMRAATSERLLLSAMACFVEYGYSAVTVRKIAAHAGLSVGVLYQHYPNKTALLLAAFERSMEQVRATFAVAAASTGSGQLPALVRAAAATVREHLAFWQLGYAARHQPEITRALGPALETWTEEIVALLSALLSQAGVREPTLDALALFAQIDGMCVHFALAPDSYPLEAVAEQVIANVSLRLRAS